MAKLLIKNMNSENSIRKEYSFSESDEEITLTGTGEKIGKEYLSAFIKTNKFRVYNLESDNIDVLLKPFKESIIPKVSIDNIKAKKFLLSNGNHKIDLTGRRAENLEIKGELERVDLDLLKDLDIEYWNSGSKRCKQIKVANSKSFNIRSRKYGGKKMFIETLDLTNIKNVNLNDCFLVKSKNVFIKADKVILNSKILDEFLRLVSEKKNFVFSAKNVGLGDKSFQDNLRKLVELDKLVKEKESYNHFQIGKISIGNRLDWQNERDEDEVEGRDENRQLGENVSFERIVKKDFTFKELLGITNIELRRELVDYFGGILKLVKKEKEKELIEKNEKGELWCIGDKNNPRNCIKFLKYKDSSTTRDYISFVPPEIKNVLQGFSWKFKIEPTEYELIKAES